MMSKTVVSPRVLVVGGNDGCVTELNDILPPDCEVLVAANVEKALAIATQQCGPDLILIDAGQLPVDGYEMCKRFKTLSATAEVPVIVSGGRLGGDDELRCFEWGAVDYLSRPFNVPMVRARVKMHIAQSRERAEMRHRLERYGDALNSVRLDVLRGFFKAAELKDNETGFHVIRIGHYSRLIAEALKLSAEWSEMLQYAAPLHDIGKIVVPDHILLKAGKLDAAEWEIMKQHCRYGAEILGEHASEPLRTASTIALTHHERWDGSGYPMGLKAEAIPLEGRIVAVADAFDALISERSYKRAWPVEEAVSFISLGAGSLFDPAIVSCFLDVLPQVLSVQARFSEDGVALADPVVLSDYFSAIPSALAV